MEATLSSALRFTGSGWRNSSTLTVPVRPVNNIVVLNRRTNGDQLITTAATTITTHLDQHRPNSSNFTSGRAVRHYYIISHNRPLLLWSDSVYADCIGLRWPNVVADVVLATTAAIVWEIGLFVVPLQHTNRRKGSRRQTFTSENATNDKFLLRL